MVAQTGSRWTEGSHSGSPSSSWSLSTASVMGALRDQTALNIRERAGRRKQRAGGTQVRRRGLEGR